MERDARLQEEDNAVSVVRGGQSEESTPCRSDEVGGGVLHRAEVGEEGDTLHPFFFFCSFYGGRREC